ncbi:MAG: radical SAM protein [Lachnospiraceae bacterium]|nr:radical SAM protein [Lachnospiraceae bacterium]MDE6251272.1 radical SAM protein [Lachnospiraceae bacterium]
MRKRIDKTNHFISVFDEKSGFYVRSSVIEDGKDTGKDPFMAEFPELIDIGIMGHCIHGEKGLCSLSGVQCYQNGRDIHKENMSVQNFEKIAAQCKDRTFQFALGGRGDPDQHEEFEEILKICRKNNIVPNFTSSGYGFNQKIVELCREYCGAVAISWYRSNYTNGAIQSLIEAGVKTNIHYVLSDSTIDEAIWMLKKNGFPERINAVVFLLHKPVGLGDFANVLKSDDKRLKIFWELINKKVFPFKIGFDSCTVPGLLNNVENLSPDSIDTCEGGRWSAYITSDMKMLPCSFDNQKMNWSVDLEHFTIEQAWNSMQFNMFRKHFLTSCPECPDRDKCMGGCPISPEIVLCEKKI